MPPSLQTEACCIMAVIYRYRRAIITAPAATAIRAAASNPLLITAIIYHATLSAAQQIRRH